MEKEDFVNGILSVVRISQAETLNTLSSIFDKVAQLDGENGGNLNWQQAFYVIARSLEELAKKKAEEGDGE